MEPPVKKARVGLSEKDGKGEAENSAMNSTEPREEEDEVGDVGEEEVDQVLDKNNDKQLLLENTTFQQNVELAELTKNEEEKCSLRDMKEIKKEKENEDDISNSWLTEYAQITFKEKEKENEILKKEYNAFVQEYARTSNQILKVVAKQKKKITDLKLKNGKQKLLLGILKKRKEFVGKCNSEAIDEKDGILSAVKEEVSDNKVLGSSFGKVGDAFKDKELMLKGKEEIIGLFSGELRDVEEGINCLNEVIREKENEISNKNKVLSQETQKRVQLEAQALEAKDAFKEALEAQMDEIERIKKDSTSGSPKMVILINQLTVDVRNAKAALLSKERESEKMQKEHKALVRKYSKDSVDVKAAFEEVLAAKEIEVEQIKKDLESKLIKQIKFQKEEKKSTEKSSIAEMKVKYPEMKVKYKVDQLNISTVKVRSLITGKESETGHAGQENIDSPSKMAVLINQLTVDVGNAKSALLAKERESEKMQQEHNVLVQKYSKDSVDTKAAFDEALAAKEKELEQIKKDLEIKLNEVSHKENFFKEALEAKSVVISQLTMRGENARRENLDLKSKNVELENRNLRQSEEKNKIENQKVSILNMRDLLEKERTMQKEEIQRHQLKEKSVQELVLRLKSENIEQEDQIALLRQKTKSFQEFHFELENSKAIQDNKMIKLEQIVAEKVAELENERGQNASTQDVIFELESCNKKQDDQIDKLEKKVSELKIKLEIVNKAHKCERDELKKQTDVLKERDVGLKSILIKPPVACSSTNYTTFISSEDEDENEESLSKRLARSKRSAKVKVSSKLRSSAQPGSHSPILEAGEIGEIPKRRKELIFVD